MIFGTKNLFASCSGAFANALSTGNDGRMMSSRNTFICPNTVAVASMPLVSYCFNFSTCVRIWLSCLANASCSASVISNRANFATFSTSCFVISIAVFPFLEDVQNGLPARPQGVRRPRRTILGTSQEDGRLRTRLEAIFNIRLFHRHALREIPRLIHIRSSQHRNVIGQELQRYRKQDRGHQRVCIRDRKNGFCGSAQFSLPFRHERNDRSPARLHFHQVTHSLFVEAVTRR